VKAFSVVFVVCVFFLYASLVIKLMIRLMIKDLSSDHQNDFNFLVVLSVFHTINAKKAN